MEIKRSILGTDTTITLTAEELEKSWSEYVWEKTKGDIVNQLLDMEEFDDVPDDLIEKIATEFLDDIDGTLRDEVMLKAIHKYDAELEQYKHYYKVFTVEVELRLRKEYTVRAKDEDDAERIFTDWSERHSRQMTEDLCDDAEYLGDWDVDGYYEDGSYDPDDAEIKEDD